mmetsp:Transcript_7626/g.16580  ORF Transcript_7626/g.16580 Transcript_7626/m.16580 type:complete len:213 (+) Transcript_7626:169-807(+)
MCGGRKEESRSGSLGDEALANGLSALPHGKAHARLNGRLGDELAVDAHIVAWHAHLDGIAIRRGHGLDLSGHVTGAEVEHRHVAWHDGIASASLLLLGKVDVGLELLVGLGGPGRADHHPAEDGALLNTTAQQTNGVARRPLRQLSVEHLDASDRALLGLLASAEDLHIVTLSHDALLHSACSHSSTTRDREDILDCQKEGLVSSPLRQCDV